MASSNSEWVGILSVILAILSCIQLLLTIILSICFPHMLTLTKLNYPVAAGLVAGFTALPISIRLRLTHGSQYAEKIYGYTRCYLKLSVTVSLATQIFCVMLTFYNIATQSDFKDEFESHMENYKLKLYSKEMVDTIQIVLQCCGYSSYRDWLKMKWKREESIDYGNIPNKLFLVNREYNSVPYSCCIQKTLEPCQHENLLHAGTNTINIRGCSFQIKYWTLWSLHMLVLLFSISAITEVILLTKLKPEIYCSESKTKAKNKVGTLK